MWCERVRGSCRGCLSCCLKGSSILLGGGECVSKKEGGKVLVGGNNIG